jgi:hypothetical protein
MEEGDTFDASVELTADKQEINTIVKMKKTLKLFENILLIFSTIN